MLETRIYSQRFSVSELAEQAAFWKPVCRYLERYIPADSSVLDLGAGFCHFINEVRCREKIAVDLNGDALRRYASPGVRQIVGSASDLSALASASVDVAFASNVYEHFRTREEVAESFREVRRILRQSGRFLILQPNFAYCARKYFDFFDHRLVFTHKGMAEGLSVCGFDIQRMVPRFLPFTSKSRLPRAPWMVGAYLRLPWAWALFGAQMLIVAKARVSDADEAD